MLLDHQRRRVHVVLVAQKTGVLVSVLSDRRNVAIGVNAANVPRVAWRITTEQSRVLSTIAKEIEQPLDITSPRRSSGRSIGAAEIIDCYCTSLSSHLIDEHSDGYAVHIEAMQEILNAVLGLLVDRMRFFQLDHALSHRLHHVRMPVPDLDQAITEVVQHAPIVRIGLLELEYLFERLLVPTLDQRHGWHAQQVLGQQLELLHDVRQPYRQLLAEENERLLVACLVACNR